MVNYPVGDFLIKLKNASMADKHDLVVDKTNLIKAVAMSLKKVNYLDEVKEEKGKILVKLTYRNKKPVLINLKLVSKPGLRIYKSVDELEKFRSPSILILSTPKGVLTIREAIKQRTSGEVIAQVW